MKLDLLNSKIKPAFFTLFISALGSTIITTIYSTVDMVCMGHHSGPVATASISYVNPFWAMMFAPGVLTGVGGSVMMANRKGAGNSKDANGYFSLSVALSVVFSIIISLMFLLFSRELLTFFGADGLALEYGVEYMRPIAVIAPTFTLSACLSAFIRNDGDAFTPTLATAIGGAVNMFLDVFLVFTLNLGVLGAGLATAIGQTVAFLLLLTYFIRKKCTLRLSLPSNIQEKLFRIITLGASAFILEVAFGTTVTVYNKIISANFSEEYLAVYGTASTVAIMFYCLFNAVGTALQPLVSTNFGAGNHKRISETMSLAIKLTVVLGVVFTLLCQLAPGAILKLYMDVNEEVMRVGPSIFRIYNLVIALTGISITSTYFFQSVLKRGYSMIISLARGIVFPILFAFILPITFGVEAVWWSIPVSELITFIISLFLIVKQLRAKDVT